MRAVFVAALLAASTTPEPSTVTIAAGLLSTSTFNCVSTSRRKPCSCRMRDKSSFVASRLRINPETKSPGPT